MPKLILDARACQLAAERLAGKPVFGGPDGGLVRHRVVDVLEEWDTNAGRWQPGTEATKHLVLGAEACREITALAAAFGPGAAQRRVLKQLTVPICSLMDQVERLMSLLNTDEARAERMRWPRADQELYASHGRALRKKHKNGPVRLVRHKVGAHLDANAFGLVQPKIRPEEVLPVLGEAVVLFTLVLKHKAPFSWIRPVDDPRGVAVETFFDYPICVRWITDVDGNVLDVDHLQIAEDPRNELIDAAVEAAEAYNDLVSKTGANLRRIVFRNSADLLAEEAAAVTPQLER